MKFLDEGACILISFGHLVGCLSHRLISFSSGQFLFNNHHNPNRPTFTPSISGIPASIFWLSYLSLLLTISLPFVFNFLREFSWFDLWSFFWMYVMHHTFNFQKLILIFWSSFLQPSVFIHKFSIFPEVFIVSIFSWSVQAAITKYHRPSGLINKFISHSSGAQVPGQDASKVGFILKRLGVYRLRPSCCVFRGPSHYMNT